MVFELSAVREEIVSDAEKDSMDSIGVAIRIKPTACSPDTEQTEWIVSRKDNSISQCQFTADAKSYSLLSTFTFDRVYTETDSTVSIYREFARPAVQSAMIGINGTIFAYGQTSSGKTFTMQGTAEHPGIVRLSLEEIFETIEQCRDEREVILRVSYLEIYNEVITDLLNIENKNLKIHETVNREIYVGNATEYLAMSLEKVMEALNQGEFNRKISATNMNERSSRSHTILRIVVENREKIPENNRNSLSFGKIHMATLNFVDLAGSERASLTGAEGLRLKEGGHINKSLLALSTVIGKLAEGDEGMHIPFRDSKLTRILQPALGGNGKTCIICTVSLAGDYVEETLGTLKFASRAKCIQNRIIVNEFVSDEVKMRRMKEENEVLKNEIDTVKYENNSIRKTVEILSEEKEVLKSIESLYIENLTNVDILRNENIQFDNENSILRSSNELLKSQNETLSVENMTLKSEIEKLKQEIINFQFANSVTKDYCSENSPFQSSIKHQNNNIAPNSKLSSHSISELFEDLLDIKKEIKILGNVFNLLVMEKDSVLLMARKEILRKIGNLSDVCISLQVEKEAYSCCFDDLSAEYTAQIDKFVEESSILKKDLESFVSIKHVLTDQLENERKTTQHQEHAINELKLVCESNCMEREKLTKEIDYLRTLLSEKDDQEARQKIQLSQARKEFERAMDERLEPMIKALSDNDTLIQTLRKELKIRKQYFKELQMKFEHIKEIIPAFKICFDNISHSFFLAQSKEKESFMLRNTQFLNSLKQNLHLNNSNVHFSKQIDSIKMNMKEKLHSFHLQSLDIKENITAIQNENIQLQNSITKYQLQLKESHKKEVTFEKIMKNLEAQNVFGKDTSAPLDENAQPKKLLLTKKRKVDF